VTQHTCRLYHGLLPATTCCRKLV